MSFMVFPASNGKNYCFCSIDCYSAPTLIPSFNWIGHGPAKAGMLVQVQLGSPLLHLIHVSIIDISLFFCILQVMFSNKYLFFTLISILFSLFYKQIFSAVQNFWRGDRIVTGIVVAGVAWYLYSRGLTSQEWVVSHIAERVDPVMSVTPWESKNTKHGTQNRHTIHNTPIALVTSNPWKVASFQAILSTLDLPFQIVMLDWEYVEDKTLGTTEWVVLAGAKACAERYWRPVLVQDTGLFIDALKGFPGINTKYAMQTIGNEWIIKLMEWGEDRSCSWIFSLGFCTPWSEPVAFSWTLPWTVSDSVRGDQGFWFDPIFIPPGHLKTFSEDISYRDSVSPFTQTVQEFAERYSHHR